MSKVKSILISFFAVFAVFCLVTTADAAKGGGGCKDKDNDGYFQKAGCGTAVDCNDDDAAINPGAAEVCDSIDNNCDGTVDEGCGGCIDNDGDGYGVNGDLSCPAGTEIDCDDNDAGVNPAALEVCGNSVDENCDGFDDICPGCTDNDGDGYGEGTDCLGPDCDETDSSVNPGASEVCDDNIDNNCDGTVDEDCGGCEPTASKERDCDCFDNTDNDCDGSIDSLDRDCKRQTCDTCFDADGDSWYTCGGDCDDSNPAIHPGASELCNGIDDNCDGSLPTEEVDIDGDGVSICEGDCDDNNPNKSPNNTEEPFGSPVCTDGIDNDCDNFIDAVDPGCEIPCIDNDGDGYGINGDPSCLNFEIDCDDNDPTINPGAFEVPYDGIDQDCNGSDLTDVDRDGYEAEVIGGIDCNDNNSLIYPGAIEGPYGDLTCCDTVDNNCDGILDAVDPGCLDSAGEAAKCEYKIIDLGTLTGSWSKAYGINNNRQIVGYASTINGPRAFLFENGVMTDIGTLGGNHSQANDINDIGQIVGNSFTATSGATAFIYENGVMTDLGLGASLADGINISGQIVGKTYSNEHAYLYDNGVVTDLGTLDGISSRALKLNSLMQIVGVSGTAGIDTHAFLFENGIMTDLGTLGGNTSYGIDINDNGQIVGYSPVPGLGTRAFLYENGIMSALGTLTGSGISDARAINNSGQIVGISSNIDSYTRAYVFDNGSMTELGTLGGRHSFAEDINNNGEIVGLAYINDTRYHAVMWAPDADNDGYHSDEDCDDTNPNINPGASEGPVGDATCADTIDNDCDGFIDSGDSGCTDGADAPHDIIFDCTVCHDPGTYVLNAVIPNSKCEQCHTPGGPLKGSYPTAPDVMTHFSSNYIDPTTGVLVNIDCVECHNPMRYQTNLAHIRSEIRGWPVVFTAFTGPGSFADGLPPHDGICEVCHTQTNHHQVDGTAPGGQDHMNGEDCRTCHAHIDGFTGFPPPPPTGSHYFVADCAYCHVGANFSDPIPNSQCDLCHTVTGPLKGSYPTAPDVATHQNRLCVECHNPMFFQANLKDIRPTITGSVFPGSQIFFTAFTGLGSFADGAPYEENICNTCHIQTNHHQADGTAPGGQSHQDGQDCRVCHAHIEGFSSIPCSGCGIHADVPHDDIVDCNYCHVGGDYAIPIPDSKCDQCHTAGGSLKGSYPTAQDVLTHSDVNGSGYYTYSNNCVECHDPMNPQINLDHVRSYIAGSIIPANIVFTAYSGAGSFADGPPYEENICNTCHSVTNYHQADGTAPGGQSHNDGTDCRSCHGHDSGFIGIVY